MIFKFGNVVEDRVMIVLHLRLDSREKLRIEVKDLFHRTFTEKSIPTDVPEMWDGANEGEEYVFTVLLKGEGMETVREVIRNFEIITIYGSSYLSQNSNEVDISYRELPDFIRKYCIIPRPYIDYD